jgi:hypothetical protein
MPRGTNGVGVGSCFTYWLKYLMQIQGNMKRLDIMKCFFNKKTPKVLHDLHTNLDLIKGCDGLEHMDWVN